MAEEPELEGIPLNTTQESAMISEGDGKPHKVEITFTEIVKDPQEIQEAIDRYNVSAAGYTIPELTEEKCSYRIAYYQVKYPEDFPRAEYGLLEVAPTFNIVNAYGEDSYLSENVNYTGLSETWELGYHPQGFDFYPGDVYEGILLYMMVDGITNYRIMETYPTDDKGGSAEHYYMGK